MGVSGLRRWLAGLVGGVLLVAPVAAVGVPSGPASVPVVSVADAVAADAAESDLSVLSGLSGVGAGPVAVSPQAVSVSFWDVPSGAPFAEEIAWLAAQGITTGNADGSFRPGEAVSRQAMAAFLYRAAGSPSFAAPVVSPFVDVPLGAPFYREIAWLADAGISTGSALGGGRFAFEPGDAVSRQAMAAFLYRAAGSPSFTAPVVSPFVDVPPGAPFYREISWLAAAGISTGSDLGGGRFAFAPGDPVSRQAMAAFLYRHHQYAADLDGPGENDMAYTVAPETVEAASGDVVSASSVGGDPVLDADGNATGTVPWSASVVLAEGAELPGVGQYYLVPPCTAAYPSGVAGKVTQVQTGADGTTTLSLGEAALDQVFTDLRVSYSGPLDESFQACPGLGGEDATPVAYRAAGPQVSEAVPLDPVIPVGMAGSGPVQGVQALGATAPWTWNCKSDGGGLQVPVQVTVADVKVTRPSVDFSIDLLRGELRLVLDADVSYSFGGSIGAQATCQVDLAQRVTWLIPGGFGASFSAVPRLEVGVSGGVSFEASQTAHVRTGFVCDDGQCQRVNQASAEPARTAASGEATISAFASLQVQLGYLDRVGFYGEFGPKAEIIVTANDSRLCARALLSAQFRLGLFADVFFTRWEINVVSVVVAVADSEDDYCTPPLPPPNPDPGDGGGDPDPGGDNDGLDVVQADVGRDQSLIVTTSGLVYADQGSGMVQVQGLTDVVQVSTSTDSSGLSSISLAVTSSGQVYAWGENSRGALGDGTYKDSDTPILVPGLSDVVQVSAGARHSLALTGSGQVYAWGDYDLSVDPLNRGDVDTVSSPIPVLLPGLSDVIQVSAGQDHSLALTASGQAILWGRDDMLGGYSAADPQLLFCLDRVGDCRTDVVQVSAGRFYSLVLTRSGDVYYQGKNWGHGEQIDGTWASSQSVWPLLPVRGLSDVVHIDAGTTHSVAVASSGDVYAWGENLYGGMGVGTNGRSTSAAIPIPGVSDVVQAYSGMYRSMFITSSGQVYWGRSGAVHPVSW